MYSKALGNGYAISAVVGKREIMEAAQTTFISSTFWTERIGPSAAIKVLEVMKAERSWERITEIGRTIMNRRQELGRHHGLEIGVSGLPARAGFALTGPNALKYKTFITQEMLKQGYLAATAIYVCIAHTPTGVDRYFDALDPIFGTIA